MIGFIFNGRDMKYKSMHKVLKIYYKSLPSCMTIVLKRHRSKTFFHSIPSLFQTKIYFGRTSLLMDLKPIYPIPIPMLLSSSKFWVKAHYNDPLWGVTLYYFLGFVHVWMYPTSNFWKIFTDIFAHYVKI